MIPRPPRSTRSDQVYPYPTLLRSPVDSELLARRRREYEAQGFDVAEADPDPLVQFGRWFDAVDEPMDEPHAMVLSTVRPDGTPSLRTVLLRGLDERGRSEERRVGKEGVSTCRHRGSRYHEKKKKRTY